MTIYASATRDRFFAVPDGTELPAGELTLDSLYGGSIEVDPEAVTGFEIPEAEAKQRIRAQLSGLVTGVGGALSGASVLAGQLAEAADALADPPRPPADPERRARVAEALDVDPSALDDPRVMTAALRDAIDEIRAAVRNGESLDAEARRAALDRLDRLAGATKDVTRADLGARTNAAAGRAAAAVGEVATLEEAASRLRDAVSTLRASSEGHER